MAARGFYAASSCFFLWLLHLTAFCAMLALDARRAGANPPGLDPCFCVGAKTMCMPLLMGNFVQMAGGNISNSETIPWPRFVSVSWNMEYLETVKHSMNAFFRHSEQQGDKEQAPEDRLGNALAAMIRCLTAHPAGIAITILMFLVVAGLSIWQVSNGLGLRGKAEEIHNFSLLLRSFTFSRRILCFQLAKRELI